MVETFDFASLTWPEVAALPRNLPLVIPLGAGYPIEMLASALGSPAQIGFLPQVPFGWAGSGLRVDHQVFSRLLVNLAGSLAEDGFSRVFILAPQGLELDLGRYGLSLPHASQAPGAPLLPSDAEREKVVFLPIGHTEQHGYHLPLSTDTQIIDAIGQGVASGAPDLACSLPAFPYGVSTHRAAFAGTLNSGGRAFEDFWLAVIDTLVGRGFSRFYLASGHGGNCSFLVNTVKYAGERYPGIFCATAWLYLSGPEGVDALEEKRRSPRGGLGHACELETALLLHLCPELVHMERVVDEMDFIATPSYFMDWVEGGALVANPSWYDDTRTGAYGAGSLASAGQGEYWLAAAVQEKIAHVIEIHEQQARRQERRRAGFGGWGRLKPPGPSR